MISAKRSLFPLTLLFIFMILLTSCGKSNSTPTPTTDEHSTTITTPSDGNSTTKEDETETMKLTLKIDEMEVDVIWADNDSVKALKNLAKDGLTINMSKYGGFEQVGSIGSTLPSLLGWCFCSSKAKTVSAG